VLVEAPGVQGAAAAVAVLDGVGDHVVVVWERVERPARRVPERRDGPPCGRNRFAVGAGDRRVVFEPVQGPVVAEADRVQHLLSGRASGQEGEDAEGLLGSECEVIAHPYRRWSPPVEVGGELVASHEPAPACTTLGDQVRLAWSTSLSGRRVDGLRAGLVALGEPAQVPGGHPGQPGSLGDRQQLVGRAQGGDLVRGGARL
jgi:hypothetical protein